MGARQSSIPNPSGTITCPLFARCCYAIRQTYLIWWFTNLDEIERCRLAGILLSCMATILTTIAISTEFWVKRFVRGIFVFRGLWSDCQMGNCARRKKVDLYVLGSIVLMLISVLTAYGSVISGTLCFTPMPRLKLISWPWLATFLCFVCGLSGAMSLFNFMRVATTESGSYLSWSLIAGWLAVIAIFLAGICYFWASRWEQELLSENLWTSRTLLTLAEECQLIGSDPLRNRKMSDTSL